MHEIRKRWVTTVLAFTLLFPALVAARVNIIVIIADDLGYGDTSVYDGWVKTPQLERMAAEGLTFTDFHSNSSVCSPTRAAFMTGRYQQRVGIVDVVARHLDTPGLDPAELTLPRLMKEGGYRSALIGKWHLGTALKNNPIHHGFDEFKGYLDGYVDYHYYKNSWYDGLEKKEQEGYTTHVITDQAVRFIERNKTRPFFLCVAHEAVHLPFQTPDDTLENRKPIPSSERWSRDRIRPKYKVMLEELDKGVGQVMDAVKRAGIAENTLVFFMSDNGAIGAGSNTPFRGGKFSHYEGGHRVPAIAWWPGKIEAGIRTDATVMGMDLLPTAAELAGVSIPETRKIDGRSLVDLLLRQGDLPDRDLFFGYEPKLGTALRQGNWKMIVKGGKAELYNLANDIGESSDLAEREPKRAREMADAIARWKAEVRWDPPIPEWSTRRSTWNGHRRHHFEINGYQAWVVIPREPAVGKPWVWRARFPGYHAEMDQLIVNRGYHLAYIDTGGLLGSPTAMKQWDALYRHLTRELKLSRKPVLEGVSRGGLFVYNWAAANPEKVSAIYCDTPVLDFKSWPGGKGKGKGSPGDWKNCLKVYGLTEEEALAWRKNPIDHAEAVVKIPLLHIVSENDVIVPPSENTYIMKERVEEAGGTMEVISVAEGTAKSNGHHFTHPDPDRVVRFMLRHGK